MATVGVLGMPIVFRQFEDDGGMYPLDNLYMRGSTDKPREDLEAMLCESHHKITVTDFGELGSAFVKAGQIDYQKLGIEAKRIFAASSADTVLVIGGDHSGAFPFYYLDGQVVRADAHGDAYMPKDSKSLNWIVSGSNYMFFVEKQGLKTANQVWNVGVQPKLLHAAYHNNGFIGRLMTTAELLNQEVPEPISFFDVDVDVLLRDYGLPHRHKTSDLKPEDLAGLMAKLNPRVVGLFECVMRYGSIPATIVSGYPSVFKPICEAVAELAIARSLTNQQNHQASSVTYH